MAAKNEYTRVLEIMAQQLTAAQRHNKLTSIQVISEDRELIQHIDLLLRANAALSRCGRFIAVNPTSHEKQLMAEFDMAIDNLKSYCQWALSNAKPQWQIEAERHGWKKMP